MKNLNIPVGVSDFAEIRKNDYYYVDKTGLITEFLKTPATKVTLITRPRRFGKTLGMSMLENFFDIRKDSQELFAGLHISKCAEVCQEWMNRWPTVFVSFKRVEGLDFKSAYDMLTLVISELYKQHLYLLESSQINEFDKQIALRIIRGDASVKEIKDSLMLLTRLLRAYYGKQVILLMDEYDVPVAKANQNGYYNEMLDMMKSLMQSLKDNQSLRFAVITGCLKIAKESIFTGTNNFVSDTITDSRLNEYFGFVQKDVDRILEDADAKEYAANIKKWYDGYTFGKDFVKEHEYDDNINFRGWVEFLDTPEKHKEKDVWLFNVTMKSAWYPHITMWYLVIEKLYGKHANINIAYSAEETGMRLYCLCDPDHIIYDTENVYHVDAWDAKCRFGLEECLCEYEEGELIEVIKDFFDISCTKDMLDDTDKLNEMIQDIIKKSGQSEDDCGFYVYKYDIA